MSGSAWDGQMRSLQTDAMQKNQHSDMKNDIRHSIVTSSHIMSQGGAICSTWTPIQFGEGVFNTVNLSMGLLTGNQMSGQANVFNQYLLCRLKRYKVIFKDVVVALETANSLGLQTMSDVTVEFRRRPGHFYIGPVPNSAESILPPDNSKYPDWWTDWRPCTDGAVEFDFEVNSREVPAYIASARSSFTTGYEEVNDYMSLGQFCYGTTSTITPQLRWSPADGLVGDHGQFNVTSGDYHITYHPYISAVSHNWLDFFFEWRARNCPNSSANLQTSASYNVQIDAEWDMSYRVTQINDTRYPFPA